MKSHRSLLLGGHALLLVLSIALVTSGCLSSLSLHRTSSPSSRSVPAPGSGNPRSWAAGAKVVLGAYASAGAATPFGVTYNAGLYGQGHDPGMNFVVGTTATWLNLTFVPRFVNSSEPGVGSYAIEVFQPGNWTKHYDWYLPIPTNGTPINVSWHRPPAGTWHVELESEGASYQCYWRVDISEVGQGNRTVDLDIGFDPS